MTRLDQAIAKAEESSVWRYRGQAVEVEGHRQDFSGLSKEERLALMGPEEARRPYVLEPRYLHEIEIEMEEMGIKRRFPTEKELQEMEEEMP